MNLLVAERDTTERGRLVALLCARGHTVCACPTAMGAVERMLAVPPEVAIVEAGLLPGQAWALLPALRELPARVYVIGVIASADPKSYADSWAAGVDDVMRRGACGEEVAGRVDARRRILSWATPTAEDARGFDLQRLEAWKEVGPIVAAALGEMLGEPLQVASGGRSVVTAAEMPASLAVDGVEVRLALGVDAPSALALATRLFGEAVPSFVFADSLRELANTAAGAFKRAALPEGPSFTLGLPVSRPPFGPPRPGERRFSLVGTDFRIELAVARTELRQRHICAIDLREGMVLAQDLRNASGLLMLAAGTSLTDRTVGRVVDLVGATGLVQVAERDAPSHA